MKVRILTTKKGRWPKWSWLRRMLWQSPNCGVRVSYGNRCDITGTSVAVFRSFKDKRWHIHWGPAWKA